MKKLSIITVITLLATAWGCNNVQRKPSRVYMPDMAYSRAYETYASTANLDSIGVHYDKKPVPGTIKRGELFPFPLAKDKPGDSTNYILAKQIPNPLPALDSVKMKEAERLYLVNCGICHGMKLDGNGPLYNGGNGPFAAAPKNLMTLQMPDGQMFYSITYGKNMMGPYGPQLSTTQRWMVIHYIKAQEAGAKSGASGASDSTASKGGGKSDSTAAKGGSASGKTGTAASKDGAKGTAGAGATTSGTGNVTMSNGQPVTTTTGKAVKTAAGSAVKTADVKQDSKTKK